MLSRRRFLAATLFVSGYTVLTAVSTAAEKPERPVKKYVRFQAGETIAYGILEGPRIRQLAGDLFGKWESTGKTHALNEVTLLVPGRPGKVLALAGNYKDHLGEDAELPKTPEPFYKLPSCLLRHEGEVIQPKSHAPVHYEAELVIVIGKRAKKVSAAQALDFVFGITCGNDISARDWQANDVQWWRAKGTDTFGPCGPYIVSGLDYNNLNMELRVNGEVRQKTNTKNMIHNIAQTISFISHHVTLNPGDFIYTGTPGKTQPLEIGDVVEVEIEGVGVLRNRLVADE